MPKTPDYPPQPNKKEGDADAPIQEEIVFLDPDAPVQEELPFPDEAPLAEKEKEASEALSPKSWRESRDRKLTPEEMQGLGQMTSNSNENLPSQDVLREERTPKEWRKNLEQLLERAKEKVYASYLFDRADALGTRLQKFGLDVVNDFSVAGRGVAQMITHPIETLRSAQQGAERAARYTKYFADRNVSLEEKAGKFKKDLIALTEGYNKLAFRHKAYITGSLILGSALTSLASLPTISAVLAKSMLSQRVLGGAGFALNRRKGMDARIAKDSEHWLAEKSDAFKNTYAGVLGLAYTGTSAVAGHYATERLTSWLGELFGHTAPVEISPSGASHTVPSAPHLTPAHTGAVAAASVHPETVPAPHVTAPETVAHAPVPEQAVAVPASVEMPSVEVARGHGYEYALKRLYEELHQNTVRLPGSAAAGSDLEKLLNANDKTINDVIHNIAKDSSHGFFNPDGTSVQINPGAHVTIDSAGNIRLNGEIHAPVGAPTTPAYPAETPALHPQAEVTPTTTPVSAEAAQTPQAEVAPAAPPEVAPTPELPAREVITRTVLDNGTPSVIVENNVTPASLEINTPLAHADEVVTMPVHSGAPEHLNLSSNNVVGPHEYIVPHVSSVENARMDHTYSDMMKLDSSVNAINDHGLQVSMNQAHVYQDSNGHIFVYDNGKDFDSRFSLAQGYVQAHPDATVWVQAEKPALYNGQLQPWVFAVGHDSVGGGLRYYQAAGPTGPDQVGGINFDSFIKQLDKGQIPATTIVPEHLDPTAHGQAIPGHFETVPRETASIAPIAHEPVIPEVHTTEAMNAHNVTVESTVPNAAHPTEPPATNIEHTGEFINQHKLSINPEAGHVFQDTNGGILAYGNSFDARFTMAQDYVRAHHDATVWVQAEKPVFYNGQWRPWVFSVHHGGFWKGIVIDNATDPTPEQIGAINPEIFVKQLDK